jgi:PHD/YefM family antitoxin component YafN of YafNO toxin-antitoxin module
VRLLLVGLALCGLAGCTTPYNFLHASRMEQEKFCQARGLEVSTDRMGLVKGCWTTEAKEAAQKEKLLCESQGKHLIIRYRDTVAYEMLCLSDEEYAALQQREEDREALIRAARIKAEATRKAADAAAEAAIINSLKQPPVVPWQPRQRTNCTTTYGGGLAQTSCY